MSDTTTENKPLDLKALQNKLALTAPPNGSALYAGKQLKACAERAIEYLNEGNTAQAQFFFEHGFSLLMQAFHYLNIDLERVVERETNRVSTNTDNAQDKVILIFGDHAELCVDGDLRGTIPLYTAEDYAELRQIAQLFQCRMEHADHRQLDLFHTSPKRKA